MVSENYDVAVAYRIYPMISREPALFPNDKYKLARLCLKSFKESLGSLKVKIWAMLDNCPKEYEALFKEFFDDNDLTILNYQNLGAFKSFNTQIKILLEQNESEAVYLAEDDYYYFPNQFEKMLKFLRKYNDVDFVTPYDRLHDYEHSPNQKYKMKLFLNKHWRSANMAFLTFLTTKETLKKTKKIFKLYGNNVFGLGYLGDGAVWTCITKNHVFNPVYLLYYLLNNRQALNIYYRAWRHGWKQILFGNKWKLWVPLPTSATHMQKNQLAPSIDWNSIFNDAKEKLFD